jgi:hypothetical protein
MENIPTGAGRSVKNRFGWITVIQARLNRITLPMPHPTQEWR